MNAIGFYEIHDRLVCELLDRNPCLGEDEAWNRTLDAALDAAINQRALCVDAAADARAGK